MLLQWSQSVWWLYIQSVCTATTQMDFCVVTVHTDCMYSHHTDGLLCGGCRYRLYVQPPHRWTSVWWLYIQSVRTATTQMDFIVKTNDFSPFYYKQDNFNILKILNIEISTAQNICLPKYMAFLPRSPLCFKYILKYLWSSLLSKWPGWVMPYLSKNIWSLL